jgi:SAM-dependent methyltransferase
MVPREPRFVNAVDPVSILINPHNALPLRRDRDRLVDEAGNSFPIVDGIPRFTTGSNYSDSFGMQWNMFADTQLDRESSGLHLSQSRLFAETRWDTEDLSGQSVLEVGSGAGRFSDVILKHTNATLYSVDYSTAVNANLENNGSIAPDRFYLFQASIYELPFPDNSFDKVFCFGVLQHTPDFSASIKALIDKAKPGGQVVVDFYPIKGRWTKICAKYLLRPVTKRLRHDKLLRMIERNVDWLIRTHYWLHRQGLGVMARFLPICNITESFPGSLTAAELRQWAILDTFDQYSPEHDHPQWVVDVAGMFECHGATVTFAGFEQFGAGMSAAVVRGVRNRP